MVCFGSKPEATELKEQYETTEPEEHSPGSLYL